MRVSADQPTHTIRAELTHGRQSGPNAEATCAARDNTVRCVNLKGVDA